jgi:hypothetical protein
VRGYDAVLKQLLPKAEKLIDLLVGGGALEEPLAAEFASVQSRMPDFTGRLVDGRILHVELQASNHPEMHWGMLEYYALLRRRYQLPIVQRVLYVGLHRPAMAVRIEESPALQFEYSLIDVRQFSATDLIAGSEADRLLALLGNGGSNRENIRQVLGSLAGLDEKSRQDALEQVLILSDLRKARGLVKEEFLHMPIDIEPEEGSALWEMQRGFNLGLAQGERNMLLLQLERRFGALPESVVSRLHAADVEQLQQWGLRVFDAKTLADVFA